MKICSLKQRGVNMKTKTLVLAISLVIVISTLCQSVIFASAKPNMNILEQEQAKADKISKKISTIEILGPLAPISLSPFFGLTCLSGASILSEKGMLPENAFLSNNETLNNPLFFVVFLLLTIATSVPKLTSVSKVFAEIADQLETYAGIVTYLAVFAIAASTQGDSTNEVVYTAGIFTFTRDTLLMAACVINIIVINTVKYFFELLVLICPIPTLDAIFECANKAIAGLLMAVYVFSPWLAFVIDVILFLICLPIFKWCIRRIRYLRNILLGPVLWSMKKKWSKAGPDARAARTLSQHFKDIELLMKVFPNRRVGRIKKKELSYLVLADNSLRVAKLRWFRDPVIEILDKDELTCEVTTGLTSNSIDFQNNQGKTLYGLLFSRIYNEHIDRIKTLLTNKD